MNLPAFTEYAPATLLRARPAGEAQAIIEVEPPPAFLPAYERAGQFCKIRVRSAALAPDAAAECEAIFAMLSSPGEEPVRFLVRIGNPEGGEAADCLSCLPDGTPIAMTLPAGEGFALERARGRDVVFVATGTGVAPVRAAIEVVLAERERYGALRLDHGVRSLAHLAIAEDIERWRARGVRVDVHVSTPEAGGAPRGATVQSALRARGGSLAGVAMVAVGQPEMLDELLAEFVRLGGAPELFLKNV